MLLLLCCFRISTYFLLARSAKSFLTAFCSSNRKALTIRIFTQLAHVAPPYARETVLSRFLLFLYAELLRCLIPGRAVLQSEHRGPLVVFLIFCAAYLPPGVRIVRIRADFVLYECLPARVTRLSAMLFLSDLNSKDIKVSCRCCVSVATYGWAVDSCTPSVSGLSVNFA